ncbi:MAG: dTDP-4-dehydrorhamnose reductase [Desulfovibrio sp.]|nr:dTDP-4-dehydrorhamnose reductase [Desulfovibrio sp.]
MPKAMILGGDTGLLGQALTKELRKRDWDVSTLGRADGDLLDYDFLESKINENSPDYVFNTIAWTRVDDAEDNFDDACALNRSLPDSLARVISQRENTRLIHYSTDFVFSGDRSAPWKETDAPNPESVYGRTKLEGEKAVLSLLPDRSCVIRTAWLFGPGRKNFVAAILKACKEQDLLTVVDDQYGSPTFTEDLAEWSAELAEKNATGIWHGVNSGQANWCELASEAIHIANCDCGIEPIPSSGWPQKAKRPSYSVLDNSRLADFLGRKPRAWPNALRDYIFSYFFKEEER